MQKLRLLFAASILTAIYIPSTARSGVDESSELSLRLICLGQPLAMSAGSMLPSLPVDALLHVYCFKHIVPGSADASAVGDPIATLSPPLKLGDVVVFQHRPNNLWVKRVVGLPGDHVQMVHGRLVLNGNQVATEPDGEYVVDSDGKKLELRRYKETLPNNRSYFILKATDLGEANDTPMYTVPEGQVFVLGDNRDDSADSRFFGFIDVNALLGVVDSYQPVARTD